MPKASIIKNLNCDLCGASFQRKANRIRNAKQYCSRKCSARASDKPRQPKFPLNSSVFLNEDANSFYLLGAYMTDGHIHRNAIAIDSKDKDWLEVIRDQISPSHPISKDNRSNCFRLECTTGAPNSPILQWFESYGCGKRKSLTLRIIKEIPLQYRADLLRGVIDGDGCIYYGKKKQLEVSVASASLGFIKDLIAILPEFNLTIRRQKVRSSMIRGKPVIPTKKYIYTFRLTYSKAIKFLEWVYYPGHQLAMPRKQQKTKWVIDNVSYNQKSSKSK